VSGSPFSSSWYRVAELTPRLRGHVRIHRHRYRGKPWYVLQDLSNQRFHRFSPTANAVIGLMDGRRTVDEIWRIASETLGDDAPTQDEMIRLLGQLHAGDALQSDVSPDTAELLDRYEKKAKRELQGRLMNPLAIRIPLFDPERFLVRTLPYVRPLLGWVGAGLWLAVVVPALILAGTHWSELTEGVFDRVLAVENLALVWLIFPVLKGLHELGHGYLNRRFGGEVHDMGIMLLVFTPVPYVDASSAHAFPEKSKRMLVGAGGMIVEIFAAAVAMLLWVNLEPGAARTVAFNVMLIGGVTTLLFNANPLLRFDGYYILGDWLEIPNLRARSNAYFRYLLERYGFGRRDAEAPEAAPGERAWFLAFGSAAFLYRFVVVSAILLFILDRSLVLGSVLVTIALVGWFGVPLAKGLRFLTSDPRLRRVRPRATAVVAGALGLLVFAIAILPVPYRTRSEGVVWLPEEALVRVETEGFVERVLAPPGARVAVGAPLFELRNPELAKQLHVEEARLRELRARFHKVRLESRARGQMLAEEIRLVERRLARTRERDQALVVRSGQGGTFVAPRASHLQGRFVRQGELLAQVLDLGTVTVRAVVSPQAIDLVRQETRRIHVRLSERLGEVLPATLVRAVPKASEILPSPALGTAGGGKIAVDPRDERGVRAMQKIFQIDLELPEGTEVAHAGGRVYVRFDHGRRPLVAQWYRGLRQLFLERFDV